MAGAAARHTPDAARVRHRERPPARPAEGGPQCGPLLAPTALEPRVPWADLGHGARLPHGSAVPVGPPVPRRAGTGALPEPLAAGADRRGDRPRVRHPPG